MTRKLQKEIQTNKKKGFTLVELIVVVAILGILAAITIPRFSQYTENAKQVALDADAADVYHALVNAETALISQGKTPTRATLVNEAQKSLPGITLGSNVNDTTSDFVLTVYWSYDVPTKFTVRKIIGEDSYFWDNGIFQGVS